MQEIKIEHILPDGTKLVELQDANDAAPEGQEPKGPFVFADLKSRYSSVLIDSIFILAGVWLFAEAKETFQIELEESNLFFFLALIFLYEPICVAFGCTLGQLACKIRVRRLSDYDQRIGIGSSYLRFILKCLLGVISYFTITSSEYRQAIHDSAAGSVMISLDAYQKVKNKENSND